MGQHWCLQLDKHSEETHFNPKIENLAPKPIAQWLPTLNTINTNPSYILKVKPINHEKKPKLGPLMAQTQLEGPKAQYKPNSEKSTTLESKKVAQNQKGPTSVRPVYQLIRPAYGSSMHMVKLSK